jgi:hypothetical protein
MFGLPDDPRTEADDRRLDVSENGESQTVA